MQLGMHVVSMYQVVTKNSDVLYLHHITGVVRVIYWIRLASGFHHCYGAK